MHYIIYILFVLKHIASFSSCRISCKPRCKHGRRFELFFCRAECFWLVGFSETFKSLEVCVCVRVLCVLSGAGFCSCCSHAVGECDPLRINLSQLQHWSYRTRMSWLEAQTSWCPGPVHVSKGPSEVVIWNSPLHYSFIVVRKYTEALLDGFHRHACTLRLC